MEQLRDYYEEAMDKGENRGIIASFEVPFFPVLELMNELGLSKDDYIEKQLQAMEKFKEYDLEGFEKSYVNEQYRILKCSSELSES